VCVVNIETLRLNKSSESTAVGAGSSAVAVPVASRQRVQNNVFRWSSSVGAIYL
jgi:precorrin-6B methylase 2